MHQCNWHYGQQMQGDKMPIKDYDKEAEINKEKFFDRKDISQKNNVMEKTQQV